MSKLLKAEKVSEAPEGTEVADVARTSGADTKANRVHNLQLLLEGNHHIHTEEEPEKSHEASLQAAITGKSRGTEGVRDDG